VLLTLLSALAAAQPEAPNPPTIYPEYGEDSVLSGELGCSDVVDCPPRARFVPFARLQLGQFWVEEDDAIEYVSEPSQSQGNLFSTFTDFGRPPPGSNQLMHGYVDLNSDQPKYDDFYYLDYDSQHGPDGFDTEDPYGVVDSSYYSFPPDLDDFASQPASLVLATMRETVRIENLEFSLQHLYDDGWVNSRPAWRIGANGWGMNLDVGQLPLPASANTPSDPNAGWLRHWLDGFNHAHYVSYGVRTVRLVDEYEVDVPGGVLGGFNVHAKVDHINLGPHLTIGRTSGSGRWLFDLSGTVLVGYGHARYKQNAEFGNASLGGAVYNRPLNFNPYSVQSRDREDFLATYAELDFTTSYFLTSHWTLDLTARAFVLGEHFSAEDHIVWNLPDFGIDDSKQSDTFAGGNLFVGASYVW
jgi:hypothetical protein